MHKTVSGIMLTLLLVSVFVLAFNIQPAKASGTIYIRADGSIDPPDAPIITYDNITYTLTDNITTTADGIIVERDNIAIDGAGYAIQGPEAYESKGIVLSGRNNVTVTNATIKNFSIGIRLESSSNYNSIIGNSIESNHDGIWLVYSSNNTISENSITDNSKGVLLRKSFGNIIEKNVVMGMGVWGWGYGGIVLEGSSNNMIIMNNITDNGGWGIDLTYCYPTSYSDNNTIIGNNVAKNAGGIRLRISWYNTLNANTITNNSQGIHLETASQNTLRGNILEGNKYSFGVFTFYDEVRLSTYTQDIDMSNTVDGKPIYYMINQNGLIIDSSDIGYLALVNSTNIHIKNVNLTNNGQGLLLAFTTNSTIENVTIAHNNVGIHVLGSDANLITGSTITNNAFGISLYRSSFNNITKNTLTNNGGGFYDSGFYYGCILIGRLVMGEGVHQTTKTIPSEDNIIRSNVISNNGAGIVLSNPGTTRTIIAGNTISGNGEGVHVGYIASNNKIYHNNFIDNRKQVYIDESYGAGLNIWDDGYPSGGNYWSDYAGVDVKSGSGQDLPGSDGIGDTPYNIDADNIDHYPLMNPYGAPPPPSYALTITATVGGTTTPAPGTYSYTANSSVQVTAIPNANYLFDHWELDTINVGSANPYTVLMDKDHVLKAVFELIPPPLFVSISPLSASILAGQSVTFTSAVSGGYTPYNYQWYLNGAPVSGATSNTWMFTPTTSGIYYVYLKVTDAKGNTAQSDTARIEVAAVPVGGYSIPIQVQTRAEPIAPYIATITILTAIFITIKGKTKRKH